jgi:serine/threonine-protein kinase
MTFLSLTFYPRGRGSSSRWRSYRPLPARWFNRPQRHGVDISKHGHLRTGQTIAIKIPHPEAACAPVFYDRFKREEEICRMMDHPGIVKEISQDSKDRVYMVLEWVEGQLLRDILAREGLLPTGRAARIAVGVSDALEYLHSRGVVYRDLKPENIMVGNWDEVRLLDFGIAALRGERRLTFGKFSRLTGTADYMAPEQVKGKRGDARMGPGRGAI